MINNSLHQAPVRAIKAESMLLLMTAIWGATFMFTKFGLDDTSPFLYLLIRFSIALSVCMIFFSKKIIRMNQQTFKQGLILGFLFAGGFVFQTYGLQLTTITKTAFITGLTVVLTPFAFKLIQNKPILPFSKVGVVIASIGLYIFTNPDFANFNIGDVLTLISTFFWAIYITYMDIFTKKREGFDETIQLVASQFIACIPIVLIGFLVFELQSFHFNPTSNLAISLAFNAIVASFILTLVHTTFQRFTTPVKAALIFSLEPVFAAIIAFIFVNEILSFQESIGAALLFFGVLTSEIGPIILTRLNK